MNSMPPSTGPNSKETFRRTAVLKLVVGYALSSPPRDMLRQWADAWSADDRVKFQQDAETRRTAYWQPVQAAGLWQDMSPKEQLFAAATMTTMTEQQHIDASWRIEAFQALLWSLGLFAKLPDYDTQANTEILKLLLLHNLDRASDFVQLRSRALLQKARSYAELWHWRSRTRQLIETGKPLDADAKMRAAGIRSYDDIIVMTAEMAAREFGLKTAQRDFAACGKAYRDLTDDEWYQVRSITEERHFALNWLCGYAPGNQWDSTPTNT